MRLPTTLALLFTCHVTALADVRLPGLFSNQMVLQQNTNNAVWGFADPGENISITPSWGNPVKTTANTVGQWRVFLKTPSHGTGHSLVLQ